MLGKNIHGNRLPFVFKKNPPAEIASGVALRQQSVLFGFLSFAFDGHNFVASFLRDVAQGRLASQTVFGTGHKRYRAAFLPSVAACLSLAALKGGSAIS
jgi:hypothetical protein